MTFWVKFGDNVVTWAAPSITLPPWNSKAHPVKGTRDLLLEELRAAKERLMETHRRVAAVHSHWDTTYFDYDKDGEGCSQFHPDGLPKAKELRRVAEPLITLAKEATLANRRLAFDRLRDRDVVTKLFNDLDEALDRKLARVTEVSGAGSVPELAFENTSAEKILLVDGDAGVERGDQILVDHVLAASDVYQHGAPGHHGEGAGA